MLGTNKYMFWSALYKHNITREPNQRNGTEKMAVMDKVQLLTQHQVKLAKISMG